MLLVLDKVVEVILTIKRNATPQKLYGISEFFFGMKIQYSIKHQQGAQNLNFITVLITEKTPS